MLNTMSKIVPSAQYVSGTLVEKYCVWVFFFFFQVSVACIPLMNYFYLVTIKPRGRVPLSFPYLLKDETFREASQ